MTYKNITFSSEARGELLSGVNKLADAVVATLGPAGNNVIIEQDTGNPVSTKDGVTVAKSIELKSKVENIGAQLVKQASIKTGEQAGDGTTTSTLLAREIYSKAIDIIGETPDYKLIDLKRGIDRITKRVINELVDSSSEITDEEQLKQVATISANNDTEVGELISTAMDKVGRDGVVTIEESKTGESYLETVEGMQFNRGYKSPYFVTDNSNMQAVLQDPFILITDQRLQAVKELLPILEACSSQNKSLLIVADNIDGEALSTLVVNKMRGILNCVAVNAPDFGDRKKAVLEDIAVLTGGQVVSKEKGMRLEKFDSSWLGKANKVTVSKDETTIIDANGNEDKITARIDEIKNQIEESVSPYEKETLQNRLAKFIGGVAIVYVGGHTEVEMKEKKDRVDDALHATKAALEEGIVPGGGTVLAKIAAKLRSEFEEDDLGSDYGFDGQLEGAHILLDALQKPLTTILENSGLGTIEAEKVLEDVVNSKKEWSGYDIDKSKIVNLFDQGIVDPTKVTRLALENAVSVAGTMLITEAVVSIGKKKKQPEVNPAMMGM